MLSSGSLSKALLALQEFSEPVSGLAAVSTLRETWLGVSKELTPLVAYQSRDHCCKPTFNGSGGKFASISHLCTNPAGRGYEDASFHPGVLSRRASVPSRNGTASAFGAGLSP